MTHLTHRHKVRPSLLTTAVICLLLGLLSGCGFQLRGQVELPAGLEPIYIAGTRETSSLAVELQNLLSASGIKLSDNLQDARHQLVILEHIKDRRSISLDENSRAAEYQLIERIRYSLKNTQGKTIVSPSTLIERRIMPNDPNRVVSTAEEEKILRREMAKNLAAKMARQLRNLSRSDQLPVQP